MFAPAPNLTLSEWAEAKPRMLSRESSSEPGPWRNDRTPYLVEIMDVLTDPAVTEVCWMAASQVGKTEVGLNLVGYHIEQDPAPIMVVQPSLPMAEAWSKDRLRGMLRDTPCLRGRVADPRSRDSQNTTLHKVFPGGHVTIVGANSAAGLASRPIRVLVLDEVDRYPDSAGTEGDPVDLAEQRTVTFWNKKKYKVSSPGLKKDSRIYAEFLASDQRLYHVACPDCGHEQVLKWDNLRWDKAISADGRKRHLPNTACYECENCHVAIEEAYKYRMLVNGRWVATNPHGQFPGFKLSALYSPWVSWAELVTAWLRAQGDRDRMQAFYNTKLAEPWDDGLDDLDPNSLESRRGKWQADVPHGVGLITVAADVQDDRFEVAVWGWGAGEECWLLAHERIWGDPRQEEVRARLAYWRSRQFLHESGRIMRPAVAAMDAGYLTTDVVYPFVRRREQQGWIAMFGRDSRLQQVLSRRPKRNKYGVKPWAVSTPDFKDELFHRLKKVVQPGPGYIHFCQPGPLGADAEFLAQLTAEVPRWEKNKRTGKLNRVYIRTRDRNEAIDLWVYGRAALHTLGPAIVAGLGRRAAKWSRPPAGEQEGEGGDGGSPPVPPDEPPPAAPPEAPPAAPPKRQRPPRRGGGFVNNWRKY